MNLEIERKFLIKCLPDRLPDDILKIDQFYLKNSSGTWERARTYHSDKNGDSYFHTVKKTISKGVSLETEKSITSEEFNKFKNECFNSKNEAKQICKERWIYTDENSMKWEIDVFKSNYTLIIAEVEIPSQNYELKIPKFMKEVILLEVTGNKKFSNRSLSLKINKGQ